MKWIKVALIAVLVMAVQFVTCFVEPAFALEPPAQVTIDGQGFYYSTGESYPINIEVVGYNSRDRRMFINYELMTDKTLDATQVADFDYAIVVYDGTGNLLASRANSSIIGDGLHKGVAGANVLSVTHLDLMLASPLPAQYSLTLTVNNVTIN